MVDVHEGATTDRRTSPVVRVAGSLLVLLGLANVVLAGISATTGLIRLSGATATAQGLLGSATVALGVLVFLGRRWALTTALTAFGLLFVVQAFAATDDGALAPALVTLLVVVLPLVLAWRATREEG